MTIHRAGVRAARLGVVLPFVLCVALGSGTSLAQPIRFAAPLELVTGAYPDAVAPGDFNHDGKRDLAVANRYSDDVTMLLGLGNGYLQRIVNCPVGRYPFSIAVADFNSDGRDDVVASVSGAATLAVVLTNPNGTCQPALQVPTGEYPYKVALADYDGDLLVDVAVLMRTSNAVWLYRGRGDGTFEAPTSTSVAVFPFDLVAGDLNVDGKMDLVASSVGGSAVSVLLGRGDATFERRDLPASPITLDLALSDLNRDAIPDLLVTGYERRGTRYDTAVRLGNGDGTFVETWMFDSERLPATGDFDGDGNIDLIMSPEHDAAIAVRLGDGDGKFGDPIPTVLGGGPKSIAVDDFNADGRLDIAVAHGGNNTSIRLGKGDGTFLREPRIPLSPNLFEYPYWQGTIAADFNGDGYSDLAIAGGRRETVLFLMNDGHGSFQAPVVVPIVGDFVFSLVAGDFDGDGRLDVAMSLVLAGLVRTLLGNGDGTFRSGPESTIPLEGQIRPGADFNLDGKADLVVIDIGPTPRVMSLLGRGDGAFEQGGALGGFGTYPDAVAVADFNEDGKPDWAVNDIAGDAIRLAFGNGDGTFSDGGVAGPFPEPSDVTAGFLDGDSHVDLVVAQSGLNSVEVLRGNGDGTFQPRVSYYAAGISPHRVLLADFDGDSDRDVVLLNASSNCISALAGDGGGHLTVPAFCAATDDNPATFVAGRFSGDARPDVAVVTHTSISLLFNVTAARR